MRGETLTRVKFSSFYGSSWIFDILILTDFLDHSASQFNFQKLFFSVSQRFFFRLGWPAHENFTESYDSRMLVGPREDLSNLKKNRTNPYRALTESCFQIFQFSKRIFHAHSHQRTERDKLEKKAKLRRLFVEQRKNDAIKKFASKEWKRLEFHSS